jgi:hypothetical protein
MKYGVVVCPKCRQVKGVELRHKSTKCIRCNKKIDIDKVKIMFETNNEEKLRNAIGLLNAELEGKTEDFKKIFEKKI